MQVRVIFNSEAVSKKIITGWGLSCLINKHILFDTGGCGEGLLKNMETLGVEIRKITSVVISHEHDDHIGGLRELLKSRKGLQVYACPGFSLQFKTMVNDFHGILITPDSFFEIEKNIFVTGQISGEYKGRCLPEQSLVIKTQKGLNVLTGCAHPGIINILGKIQNEFTDASIYSVFGGFHLKGNNQESISDIAGIFKKMKIERAGPTHCSGENTKKIFKKVYKNHFIPSAAGISLDL